MSIIQLSNTNGTTPKPWWLNTKYIHDISVHEEYGTGIYHKNGRTWVKETPEEIQDIINMTKALNKMKVKDLMQSRRDIYPTFGNGRGKAPSQSKGNSNNES